MLTKYSPISDITDFNDFLNGIEWDRKERPLVLNRCQSAELEPGLKRFLMNGGGWVLQKGLYV